jgi:hypothetical protein
MSFILISTICLVAVAAVMVIANMTFKDSDCNQNCNQGRSCDCHGHDDHKTTTII